MAVKPRSPVEALHGSESIGQDPAQVRDLGLCDRGPVEKLGVKGPGAAAWLQGRNLPVPDAIYDLSPREARVQVVRSGFDEFVLRADNAEVRDELRAVLADGPAGVYPFEHESAVFALTGRRAREVLAQTCAVNFAEPPDGRIIYTRLAGATCAVIPQCGDPVPHYELWVDHATAPYLWQTLREIVKACEGSVVSADLLTGKQ